MNEQDAHLQPSIFGKAPIGGIIKQVADFLFPHLISQVSRNHEKNPENEVELEVEAKFGILIDRQTKKRLSIPIVNTETILNEQVAHRELLFESDMTTRQHSHFNQLLNERVRLDPQHVKYKHTKEIDEFYNVPNTFYSQNGSGGARNGRRVRVSRDEKTGRILRMVEKEKLENLHFYCPASSLDCRLSVSRETKFPLGIDTQEIPNDWKLDMKRRKDRISYTHQLWQIDLTQVISSSPSSLSGNGGAMTADIVKNELELEIGKIGVVAEEARKASESKPNKYLQLISVLVNNILALSQKNTLPK